MNPSQTNSVKPSARWVENRFVVEALVFLAIIVLGFVSRFWLLDMPNFKPVAALVLFGAFFFRRSSVAIVALLFVMILSDFKLGVYDWTLTLSVYVGLGVAGLLGIWIKRSCEQGSCEKADFPKLGRKQAGRFMVASIAMSTTFYLLTNAAVWMIGGWYPSTFDGLIHCYTAAIPFYRATLLGDLCFTGALVGVYASVQWLVAARTSRVESNAVQVAGL